MCEYTGSYYPIFAMADHYAANAELADRPFIQDVHAYLANGYVLSTPKLFIMARPVCRNAPASDIANLLHRFDNPDCWHVQAAAGDMSLIWECCPLDLPYARWVHNGRVITLPMERAKSILTHVGKRRIM